MKKAKNEHNSPFLMKEKKCFQLNPLKNCLLLKAKSHIICQEIKQKLYMKEV